MYSKRAANLDTVIGLNLLGVFHLYFATFLVKNVIFSASF